MQVGERERELADARQQEREVLHLAFSQFRDFLCAKHAALAAMDAAQPPQRPAPADAEPDAADGAPDAAPAAEASEAPPGARVPALCALGPSTAGRNPFQSHASERIASAP
jgi:hypothetical protein